jgi:hypothetical protein
VPIYVQKGPVLIVSCLLISNAQGEVNRMRTYVL